MGGRVDGLMEVKAVLRIAYSNQKYLVRFSNAHSYSKTRTEIVRISNVFGYRMSGDLIPTVLN